MKTAKQEELNKGELKTACEFYQDDFDKDLLQSQLAFHSNSVEKLHG